jgi:hypothetical protein
MWFNLAAAAGDKWAAVIWDTAALVETIMRERSHPEQGFRAAVGIIRLVKSYGGDRLEAACGRRWRWAARFADVGREKLDESHAGAIARRRQ